MSPVWDFVIKSTPSVLRSQVSGLKKNLVRAPAEDNTRASWLSFEPVTKSLLSRWVRHYIRCEWVN